MKNKLSIKHHYLPRKYLKGFTDPNNQYWIYDKKQDVFFKSNPNNTFFENHLNTIKNINGDHSDSIEALYSEMEGSFWRHFDNIVNSNPETPINFEDKAHLYLFLLHLHWRLPSNIKHAERIADSAFTDNSMIEYFHLKNRNGEKVANEIIGAFRSSCAFKKFAKLIAPFSPFYKNQKWNYDLANWSFLHSTDQKGWLIIGDNPIVTNGINNHDPKNCLNEFIFPVSDRILLVKVNLPLTTDMPPDFIIMFDIAIIEQADRFVACKNELFLKTLVKYHSNRITNRTNHLIISELFRFTENRQ